MKHVRSLIEFAAAAPSKSARDDEAATGFEGLSACALKSYGICIGTILSHRNDAAFGCDHQLAHGSANAAAARS
jgi:hypothetical protein